MLIILLLMFITLCNSNSNSNSHSHSYRNQYYSINKINNNNNNDNDNNNTYFNTIYDNNIFIKGGDVNMGYRLVPDAALGKDREIFHLAIDLKWLWSTIIDDSTWLNLLNKFLKKIKSLTSSKNAVKRENRFKEIVTDILIGIKVFNRASTLKLFLGDLKQMEKMSTMNAKFVVVYVEGGDSKVPSRESLEYRKALSDISLGSMLNEQFIFSATSTQIPAMQKLVKKLNSGKECPFFAVLCPSSIENEEGLDSGKQMEDLELLATLRLPINEIKSNKISRFLVRTLQVFDAKLNSLKAYSEEMHASAKKLNDTAIEINAERLRRLSLQKSLPTEPSIIDRNTITITIRPRQGERGAHIRRFRLNEHFQEVLLWVDSCGALMNRELIVMESGIQSDDNIKLSDIKKVIHY